MSELHKRMLPVLALAVSFDAALAQDGVPVDFDATGPDAPTLSEQGPLTLWSADGLRKGDIRFGALAESAGGLLERAGEGERQVLALASGLNLSGGWALSDRIGFEASLSGWVLAPSLNGRFAVGAVRVDAPIRVLQSDEGVAVAVIPWGAVPVGPSQQGVASRSPALGLVAAARVPAGPLVVNGNLGASARTRVDFPRETPFQTIGGPSLDFGVGVGVRPGDLSVDAELRGAWSFSAGSNGLADEVPDANLFAEAGVSAGYPVTDGITLRAGAATGVSTGIGTSVGRGFLGVVWRDRAEKEAVIVVDPEPDVPDPVPTEPSVLAQRVPIRVQDVAGNRLEADLSAVTEGKEPVQAGDTGLRLLPGTWAVRIEKEGYGPQDRTVEVVDGVRPDPIDVVLLEVAGESSIVHTVKDAAGQPVAGAVVLLDGLPVGTTGEDGTIAIAGLADGDHTLTIDHPSFSTAEQAITLDGGALDVSTPLARVPGTVRVVAIDVDGVPVVDGVVRFAGPRRLAPMPLGDDGERTEVLGPGTWQVLVSSPELGFQQRELVIAPDRFEPITVTVVLKPSEGGDATLVVRVVDPQGQPVDQATVALDGQDFGTTSTGGQITLDGLNVGQRDLTVRAPWRRRHAPIPVVLVEGLSDELVTLAWEPYTVQVTALMPTGIVDDAKVRFAGPDSTPPVELGPTGSELFQLKPGEWTVLVTSPTYGIQQRSFTVEPDSRKLHEVTVVLASEEGGVAGLSLEVTDPTGRAVEGASVFLDSLPLGTTTAGALLVEGLATGERVLEIESTVHASYSEDLELVEGTLERSVALDWAPGVIRVKVRDAEGRAVPDGTVRFLGPRSVPPAPVDTQGERLFVLEPGEWQALAISPTLGMAQVSVEIVEGQTGIQEVIAEIRPQEAGLGELVLRVVDGAGRPVPDANVIVDGRDRGTAGSGGVLVARKLVPGPMAVEVSAPRHEKKQLSVEVLEGSQVRYVTLAAIPARLAVAVQDEEGRPIDAEVTLVGPEDWMPMQIGADGREELLVAPGTWQVVARAKGLGAAREEVTVRGEDETGVLLTLSPSQVDVTDGAVMLRDVVLFDTDKSSLRPEADPVLDEVANTLVSNTAIIRVQVQGHTDSQGDLAYNQALSQRRAASVRAALVERGVAPEVLVARGFGAQRPVADNATAEGRAANRRVEFAIGDE